MYFHTQEHKVCPIGDSNKEDRELYDGNDPEDDLEEDFDIGKEFLLI